MKDFIKNNLLAFSILLGGLLISISIYYAFNLETLQKLFSIIGSSSLGVALAAYFYKKKQDKDVAAIDQISFFREKIIPEWDKVSKIFREKNPRYIFSQIRLNEFTIAFMRKHYSRIFKNQLNMFFNDIETNSEIWDAKVLDPEIILFNMLEEFSLKVLQFKTYQHQALNSVRAAFVDIIEKNAVALIFIRDIIAGDNIYFATLQLYDFWKKDINRTYLLERLEKHGFITKERLEVILQKNEKKL